MKLAGFRRTGVQQVLEKFLNEVVVVSSGSNVTMAELYHAYTGFCAAAGTAAYARSAFCRRTSKLITEKFGQLKTRDLKRTKSNGEVTLCPGIPRSGGGDHCW